MSILSFSILIPAFLSITLFSLNVPDGIHNDALPGSRSLFSHGNRQPDARATMVIKFCLKASSLPLREKKMLQSTKLVISYLGVLTNRKNYWIIWENFQQLQVRSFFAAL